MRSSILLGLLILLITACNVQQGGPDDGPIAPPVLAPDAVEGALPPIPTPPDVDYYDLTERLRGIPATSLPRAGSQTPAPQDVGTVRSFVLTDLQNYTRFNVSAELKAVSPHAYWYVEQSIPVDQRAIDDSAQVFEQSTYPTDTRIFGDTIRNGFDGDPHLTILISRFNGAAGYYSSPDEYPKAIHPFSNERLMLYINGGVLPPGSSVFNDVVAHELQHAIHWHADSTEESWVNEGLSTLAEELNGHRTPSVQVFSRNGDVQLTHWEDDASANTAHYAAAHLFFRFLGEHWGGYDRLRGLVADPRDSITGINSYLAKLGYAESFRDVFRAWAVANAGNIVYDPRYQYGGVTVQVKPDKQLGGPASFSDQVRQYASKYIESTLLQPGASGATITFDGAQLARMLPTDAHSGTIFWWGNRGDSINTMLTREIDLESVTKATLKFWAWFDIEKGWDYAYVEVSADGGKTWTVLNGKQTSQDNPLGNSFGSGFTGRSGGGKPPQWVQEQIDISAFAGKKVLVRFEYVTDEAVNTPGFAVDDIEVPEINFKDDGESDLGWDSKGFARINNRVAQDYIVQVITVGVDGSAALHDVPLDEQEHGQIQICCYNDTLQKSIIIVSALAPFTSEQTTYQLSIQATP